MTEVRSVEQVTAATAANEGATCSPSGPTRWLRWACLIVIIGSVVVVARALPTDRLVASLSARVDRLGPWAPVAFGLVYVVAAVLFVPGSALTLASGAAFGLGLGTLTVSLASTVGAVMAFLIGRTAARPAVARAAATSSRFAALDRAIAVGGWRVIALLRLSPAVPFSLGNYLFGLTSIRLVPYALASWLAMLPGTFLYVYLGHAGRSGVEAATGAVAGRSPGEWVALGVGLVATVAVTVYVTRLAAAALRSAGATTSSGRAGMDSPIATGAARPGRGGTIALAAVAILAGVVAGFVSARRATIAGWFGPPRVTLAERFADRLSDATFDHGEFDRLLRAWVDGDGRVDYVGLAGDLARLDRYLERVASAPLDRLGRDERLAFLLNAYNACTLRLVLDYRPIASIKDIPAAERWDAVRWVVGGRRVSLSTLEHEYVRPDFRDPRVHFALVCAARGCPPLRAEAYVGARIDAQLESQAAYVHSHGRWFQLDAPKRDLGLTALYDWYADDFQQVAGSVLAFAGRHAPALRAEIEAGRAPVVRFLPYDWSLNSREESR